jgi:hypothetical protein
MATIMVKYDPDGYWEQFLHIYMIRHEKIFNDDSKFILYYESDYHLLKIGYEFGLFYQKKMIVNNGK